MKKILIALSVVSLLGLSFGCNRQESGSSQEQTERSDSTMDSTGSGPSAGGSEMQGTESNMGSDAQQMEESGSDIKSDSEMMEDSGSDADSLNP